METTQYINKAKVFSNIVDAKWASAHANQCGYGVGPIEKVEGGWVALYQTYGEEGEMIELYVV